MFWLDITFVACLLIGIVKGLIDGLVKQIIALLALVLAIFLSGTVATWMRNFTDIYLEIRDSVFPTLLDAIYYLFAFAVILSLLISLAHVISKAVSYTPIGPVNKIFGAVFGGFFMLLCLSIVLNVLSIFDSNSMLISKQAQTQSVYYGKVRAVFPQIYPYVKDFLDMNHVR